MRQEECQAIPGQVTQEQEEDIPASQDPQVNIPVTQSSDVTSLHSTGYPGSAPPPGQGYPGQQGATGLEISSQSLNLFSFQVILVLEPLLVDQEVILVLVLLLLGKEGILVLEPLPLGREDIPVLELLQGKVAILVLELLLGREDILVVVPKGIPELDLREDTIQDRDMEEVRVPDQELHPDKDMEAEVHLQDKLTHKLLSGSTQSTRTEVDKLTARSFREPWSMGTGATSRRRLAG